MCPIEVIGPPTGDARQGAGIWLDSVPLQFLWSVKNLSHILRNKINMFWKINKDITWEIHYPLHFALTFFPPINMPMILLSHILLAKNRIN